MALYELLAGLCQVQSKFLSVVGLLVTVLFLFGFPLILELAPYLRKLEDVVSWWSLLLLLYDDDTIIALHYIQMKHRIDTYLEIKSDYAFAYPP